MSGLFQYRLKEISPDSDNLQNPVNREFSKFFLSMSVLFALALIPISLDLVIDKISHKNLIAKYHALRFDNNEELIYLKRKPYSASFYSNGEAQLVKDFTKMKDYQSESKRDFFVTRKIKNLPKPFLEQVDILGKYGRYHLLREKVTE